MRTTDVTVQPSLLMKLFNIGKITNFQNARLPVKHKKDININTIMGKVSEMFKYNACFKCTIHLDFKPNYKQIQNIWNFHCIKNKFHRDNYHFDTIDQQTPQQVLDIYASYYEKKNLLRDLFISHSRSDVDHIICFYIKDEPSLFLFYKSKKLIGGGKPFINILLTTRSLSDSLRKDFFTLDNENNVLAICFSEDKL